MDIIGTIKNYLGADQPLITNIATFIALLGAFFAALHYTWKGIKWGYNYFTRKSLYRRLKPYFSKDEILRATENYIPTQCQNVDPAVSAEPGRVHAFALREKLIPFFMNQVFKEKKEDKYFLVLADSGMGKTTFMINLFLKYMRKPFKSFNMKLLPLGHPNTDAQIDAIENKKETILLLDAFDEDIRAAKDFKARMQEIISKTSDFLTVIITSRTQFFPTDPDIPEETGLYKFGGNKGLHRFYRLYVSPFNTKDINRYLRRKYPVYRLKNRRKARAIVEKSPDLMVRPMLLAYIDDLIERSEPYEVSGDIYKEMIRKWIQRERVENKEELRRFSEVIARDMYENQQDRGGLYIDHRKIHQFAKEHDVRLEEFEMRSSSLLNRNAEGKYKFAHKSILEYLLSLEIIRKPMFCLGFNFDNMEQAQRFYWEYYFRNLRKLNGSFRLLEKKGASYSGISKELDVKKLPLNELENVTWIDLSGNQITDISPLIELINIYNLELSDNQITDISPLSELKNILFLKLNQNQITDITPLLELKNIRKLNLSGNQITDILPLTELKIIRNLNLSANQISDISPLMALKNIEYLDLNDNQITDISPLTELKNLSWLDLRNNQITDISPLKAMSNFKTLYIVGNPIKKRSVIAEMIDNGVKVTY